MLQGGMFMERGMIAQCAASAITVGSEGWLRCEQARGLDAGQHRNVLNTMRWRREFLVNMRPLRTVYQSITYSACHASSQAHQGNPGTANLYRSGNWHS
jgi:hypothetical protein